MALREFKLPDPGEGLLEAEIVEWKVAVGDSVTINDIVVEVETAKSLVELPIPYAGVVAQLHVAVGDEVEVGTVIITIEDGEEGGEVAARGVSAPGAAAPPAAAPAAAAAATGATEAAGAEEPDEEPVKTLVGYGPKASGTTRRARKVSGPAGSAPRHTETTATATVAPMSPAPASRPTDAPATTAPASAPASTPVAPAVPLTPERIRALAKPPVRKLARDLGVDLGAVTPSGDGGIVTRADVETYAASAAQGQAAASTAGDSAVAHKDGATTSAVAHRDGATTSAVAHRDGATTSADAHREGATGSSVAHKDGASAMPLSGGQLQSVAAGGGGWGAGDAREVRFPIKGVRKVTAAAMVSSAFTAPHVTEWVQVDVTATMDLVARLKNDREFRDVKVTPLTILAKAICLAVRRNPGINATWDEDAQEIVEKRYVNLGIAAATPRGLIVPNVKEAQSLTLRELAGALNALTATAREGRTSPADQAGGTITITNVGVFGVDGGTPILNRGEGAILAFGQVRRLPWVVTGADGAEEIVPRSVTTLALSFDHRFIDGELGSRFLADVAAIMADPSRALVWG